MQGSKFPKILELFFHSLGSKRNYDKPQKTGWLFSRKYEFGTPVGIRNLPKFENRDFRWLLTLGIFGVSKLFFALLVFLLCFSKYKSRLLKSYRGDNMSSDTDFVADFYGFNEF